jgi:hypothetical protein
MTGRFPEGILNLEPVHGNGVKVKSGGLTIILEESMEYTSNE